MYPWSRSPSTGRSLALIAALCPGVNQDGPILHEHSRLDASKELVFEAIDRLIERRTGVSGARVRVGRSLWRPHAKRCEALLSETVRHLDVEPSPCAACLTPALNNLGVVWKREGRDGEAAALFERSLHLLERTAGTDDTLLLRPLINLGSVSMALAGVYSKGCKDTGKQLYL